MTDIGHYSLRILPQLSKYAQIEVWTEKELDRSIALPCPVKDSNVIKWIDLNSGSITIYNIGNNAQYHARIWETSTQHPGIVVLHDYHLHHFFAGIFEGRVARKITIIILCSVIMAWRGIELHGISGMARSR